LCQHERCRPLPLECTPCSLIDFCKSACASICTRFQEKSDVSSNFCTHEACSNMAAYNGCDKQLPQSCLKWLYEPSGQTQAVLADGPRKSRRLKVIVPSGSPCSQRVRSGTRNTCSRSHSGRHGRMRHRDRGHLRGPPTTRTGAAPSRSAAPGRPPRSSRSLRHARTGKRPHRPGMSTASAEHAHSAPSTKHPVPACDSASSAPIAAAAPASQPARDCCEHTHRHPRCIHNPCAAPGPTQPDLLGPAPLQELWPRSRAAVSPHRRRCMQQRQRGGTGNGLASGT